MIKIQFIERQSSCNNRRRRCFRALFLPWPRGAGAQSLQYWTLNLEAAMNTAKSLQDMGITAQGFECNVLKKESIEAARLAVNEAFGTCDILINGAGGNHPKGTTSKDHYEDGR